MKEDISQPKVKNVTVVVKPEGEREHWSVHLVNANNFSLKDILVASKGYSDHNQQETSVLRQFFEDLGPNSSIQIELIDPAVFHLFNEYGVTYYVKDEIYFKKFVFAPDSIIKENLSFNKIINGNVIVHS
jgi:hypothetical protein